MPTFRNFLRQSLKAGRTGGKEQDYNCVRSGHNPEMDGDKQPKAALGNTKGRSTKIQKDTEGKKGVKQTTYKNDKGDY